MKCKMCDSKNVTLISIRFIEGEEMETYKCWNCGLYFHIIKETK